MKKLILIILVCVLSSPLQSQIWEQISTPYDYMYVSLIASMNDDVYISRFDPISEKRHNYKYDYNEWVRAEDDTIYDYFGTSYMIEQYADKIVISCNLGIFLSTDSGENWTKTVFNQSLGVKVKDIEIMNDEYYVTSILMSQLFKLNKETFEWEIVNDIRNDETLEMFVETVESNSTHLFATQLIRVSPRVSNDTLEGGLYLSIDKGETWEKTLIDTSVYTLYATDDLLIVSTAFGNVMRSEDNGKTWDLITLGASISDYFNDGDRLLACSNPLGIIESRDNGKTWQVLNEKLSISKIYRKEDKYFFMGVGNIVFESDSMFKEIKHTNLVYPNSLVRRIYNHNDTLLSVGSFKRGVQYSTDLGESWETYFPYLEDEQIEINSFHERDNQIYLRAPYSLYASTDYGKTFEHYQMFGEYLDLLILEDKILLYGNRGHVISRDYGKTFSMMDTTVLKNDFKIFKMVQTANGDLLAFSQFDGVFKSTDNADTWTKLVESLPTGNSYAAVYNFYEFSGNYYAFNSYPALLFKSTDKGKSWDIIDIELFNEIEYFSVEMIDENNILISCYGEGLNGLRFTSDQGKTWAEVESNLPSLSKDIYSYRLVGMFEDYILLDIGFQSRLVGQAEFYRTTTEKLSQITSVEYEQNTLVTSPPYPQPARSAVTIEFGNYILSKQELTIYNIEGIEIKNQEITINNNSITWDCSAVQPGIYLINIKHGSEEKAVKVVVE